MQTDPFGSILLAVLAPRLQVRDVTQHRNTQPGAYFFRRSEASIGYVGQVNQHASTQQAEAQRGRKNGERLWRDLYAGGGRRNDAGVVTAKVLDQIDLLQSADDRVVKLLDPRQIMAVDFVLNLVLVQLLGLGRFQFKETRQRFFRELEIVQFLPQGPRVSAQQVDQVAIAVGLPRTGELQAAGMGEEAAINLDPPANGLD